MIILVTLAFSYVRNSIENQKRQYNYIRLRFITQLLITRYRIRSKVSNKSYPPSIFLNLFLHMSSDLVLRWAMILCYETLKMNFFRCTSTLYNCTPIFYHRDFSKEVTIVHASFFLRYGHDHRQDDIKHIFHWSQSTAYLSLLQCLYPLFVVETRVSITNAE